MRIFLESVFSDSIAKEENKGMIVLEWNVAGFCVLETAPLKSGALPRFGPPARFDSANAIESFSQQRTKTRASVGTIRVCGGSLGALFYLTFNRITY